MKILFLQKHFEKQPVEPGIGVPIDEPQIIAGHVAAKIGEFNALPFPLAASLPLHPAAEDLPANQLEPLELGETARGLAGLPDRRSKWWTLRKWRRKAKNGADDAESAKRSSGSLHAQRRIVAALLQTFQQQAHFPQFADMVHFRHRRDAHGQGPLVVDHA